MRSRRQVFGQGKNGTPSVRLVTRSSLQVVAQKRPFCTQNPNPGGIYDCSLVFGLGAKGL